MATLRELIIKFSLKADTKEVKRFAEALESAKQGVGELVAFGGKVAAAYTGVGAVLAHTAASAADFGEEVLRSASAFGITTSKFQEQNFAMQALGASSDDLADAYSTLSERAVEAMEGSKTQRREFDRMGISIDELKGKNPGELFDLYIERASQMTDATQAAAASAGLLGDDLGRRIARGLRTSGSSFTDYIKIIRTVGGVFDKDLLEKAQQAQVRFRLLGATFMTLRRRIGLELAPILGELAAKIVRVFQQNGPAIDLFIRRLRDGVQKELGRLEEYVKSVDKIVTERFGGWVNLAENAGLAFSAAFAVLTGAKIIGALQPLVPLFKAITEAVAGASAVALTLAAAITILILLFEDFWVFLKGGESLIGNVIENLREGGAISNFLADAIELVTVHFQAMLNEFDSMVTEVGMPLWEVLKALGEVLAGLLFGSLLTAVVGFTTLIRAAVLLIRIVGGMVRAFFWLGDVLTDVLAVTFDIISDAFVSFINLLSESLAAFPNAFMNFWNTLRALVTENIFEPVIQALGQLKQKLMDLPGASLFISATGAGAQRPRETGLDTLRAASQAATPTGGGRGAASGNVQANQQNQYNFEVKVDGEGSEETGRKVVRGAKSEVEDSGVFGSLAEFFSAGEE